MITLELLAATLWAREQESDLTGWPWQTKTLRTSYMERADKMVRVKRKPVIAQNRAFHSPGEEASKLAIGGRLHVPVKFVPNDANVAKWITEAEELTPQSEYRSFWILNKCYIEREK